MRPGRRKALAQRAVQERGICVRLACSAFGISEICYRYVSKQDPENAVIANRLLRLTENNRNLGFGRYFLYLRNVKGFR